MIPGWFCPKGRGCAASTLGWRAEQAGIGIFCTVRGFSRVFLKNCTVYTKQRVSRQGTDTKTTFWFGLVFAVSLLYSGFFRTFPKPVVFFLYTQRPTHTITHTHTHTRQGEKKFTSIPAVPTVPRLT